jgi:hypothetical protein
MFKTYKFGLFGCVYTFRAKDKFDALKMLRADLKSDGFHPNRAKGARLISVTEDLPQSFWNSGD